MLLWPTRVWGGGEETPRGFRGRDVSGLGGTNSWNKGKGACFPGFWTEKVGVLRGRQKAGSSGEQKEGRAKRELWGWGFQRSRS